MLQNFSYCKNILKIKEKNISFQYDIYQAIEYLGNIFVLLDIPMNIPITSDELNNMFCYDMTGKIIWQVKNSYKVNGVETALTLSCIGLTEKSELFAIDYLGRQFLINRENGTIEKILRLFK